VERAEVSDSREPKPAMVISPRSQARPAKSSSSSTAAGGGGGGGMAAARQQGLEDVRVNLVFCRCVVGGEERRGETAVFKKTGKRSGDDLAA
jgi:hypothetical protein